MSTAYHVVCIRSTVLPGTVEGVVDSHARAAFREESRGGFGDVHEPRVSAGGPSIADFGAPPLTIIGEFDARSGDRVAAMYAGVRARHSHPAGGRRDGEGTWAMRFTRLKVTFANEVGSICKRWASTVGRCWTSSARTRN